MKQKSCTDCMEHRTKDADRKIEIWYLMHRISRKRRFSSCLSYRLTMNGWRPGKVATVISNRCRTRTRGTSKSIIGITKAKARVEFRHIVCW